MVNLRFESNICDNLGPGYEVFNKDAINICAIRKVRTGTWQHWCIVVEHRHLGEGYIFIMPSCQDEIRQRCRELNAGKFKDESN